MTGVAATRQRLPRLIRLSEINPYPDTVLHAVTRTRTVVSYGRAAAGERRGLNVLHGRRVTESALARICLMAICDRGTRGALHRFHASGYERRIPRCSLRMAR
jgi:hypothetical protein